MENFLQIKLFSVFSGKSYNIYMILKWLKVLVFLLGILLIITKFLVIAIPVSLIFIMIIILNIVLNKINKKERLFCTLTETQFILENLEFNKKNEFDLSDLKSITYILESNIIDVPSRSPNLVGNLNRIIIIKSNNEKINLLFLINGYHKMNDLKVKINQINHVNPNVNYKIGYI